MTSSIRSRALSALATLGLAAVASTVTAAPARAVTHIDVLFDCAAIEASSANVPKFWAQAGDTVTVTFTRCNTGAANSFNIFGGNGNGMFLNYDTITNATNSGLTDQWLVFENPASTEDWVLEGTIQATANGGTVTLSSSYKTIGYYSLPNLGGTIQWALGGVGAAQSLTPGTQTASGTAGQSMTTTAFTASNFPSTPTFSVLETLPSGLSIDSSTGIISGTPASAQAATTYTVLATTPTAQLLAKVTIEIDPPAPGLSGGTSALTATAGEEITPTAAFSADNFSCTPTFSVSPALPSGLSLDTGTGAIFGTPTDVLSATPFTITASCDSESASHEIAITIEAAPDPEPEDESGTSTSKLAVTGFDPATLLGLGLTGVTAGAFALAYRRRHRS